MSAFKSILDVIRCLYLLLSGRVTRVPSAAAEDLEGSRIPICSAEGRRLDGQSLQNITLPRRTMEDK
jgi:hypothetical protein